MKKLQIFSIILCLSLLFVSCGDKSKKSKSNEIKFVKSVLFYDEGSLWTENEKGEMEWYKTLTLGDTLDAYPTVEGSTSEVVESKLAVRSGKTEQVDYTKVRYNDADYWMQSVLLIPNSSIRLVTGEDVLIYTDADITTVTNGSIPSSSIVAYSGETKEEASGITFAKISYKAPNKAYRDVFIKAENLSTYADDAIAQRLLNIIPTYKNEVVQKELLANITNLQFSGFIHKKYTDYYSKLYPTKESKNETVETADEADETEEAEEEAEYEESEEDSFETTTSATSTSSSTDDYYEFD